ncbi:hypothetical protein GCM10010313_75950 [Streptomyces violarus]|uniref:Uncharacterized protein n=1 Tax=Streptomyces violarus TaxID=67380 RepID=A0A7W4ZQD5_9ACTN|nr:hypothetical protein [Streptomyces violarus]GHD31958.1 hypothetical protein GCM10010313_75950 [Streptomyces violarus]
MADRYLRFTGTAPGRFLTRRLGLPRPAALTRWSPERPALDGGLRHLTAGRSGLDLAPVLARTGIGPAGSDRAAAVVLDASGVRDVEGLAEVHAALYPAYGHSPRAGACSCSARRSTRPTITRPPPSRPWRASRAPSARRSGGAGP